MEHLQISHASINDATETVLPTAATDESRIRPDLGPGYLRALDIISANAQYCRVLPQGDTIGVYVTGRIAAFLRPGVEQRIPEMILPQSSPYTIYGYQNAGAAQHVHAIQTFRYGTPRPPSAGKGKIISQIAASDVNSVANAWQRTHNSIWTNTGFELVEGKTYEIRGMRAYGTGLIGARLVCAEWGGLKPGVPGFPDDTGNIFYFQDCPRFRYPSTVSIESFATGVAAQEADIIIAEV